MAQDPVQVAAEQESHSSRKSVLIRGLTFAAIGAAVLLCGGLLVSAIHTIREAEDQSKTKDRLRLVGLSAHSANDAYKRLPPGVGGPYGGKTGTVLYHIFPFMVSGDVWNLGPEKAADEVIFWFLSPLDDSAPGGLRRAKGGSNFAGNINLFPIFPKAGIRLANLPAGGSHVIMFVTVAVNCSNGGHTHSDPAEPPLIGNHFPTFAKPHSQGTPAALSSGLLQVAMADASVRKTTVSVNPANWILALDIKAAPDALPENWAD